MANRSAASVQRHMTDLAVSYMPPEQYFIAPFVCPAVSLNGSTNFTYYEFDFVGAQLLANNIRSARRAGGEGGVNGVTWELTKRAGLTLEKANFADVDRKDVRDFGRAIAEENAMKIVRHQLLLQKESRIVDLFQTTSGYPSSSFHTSLSTASDKWDDFENSDPEDDIKTGAEVVTRESGQSPNTLVIPYGVAQKFSQHPAVKAYQGNDNKGNQSDAFGGGPLVGLPPELFGYKVIVPKVTYVSSNPGQTEARTFLWGKHVSLCYVNPAPSVDTPSFAYDFQAETTTVDLFDWNRPGGGQYVEGWEDDLQKIIASRMAYLIQNVVN